MLLLVEGADGGAEICSGDVASGEAVVACGVFHTSYRRQAALGMFSRRWSRASAVLADSWRLVVATTLPGSR